MDEFPAPPRPIVEIGLAAAVLGTVAAVLFLLPILSIPLSRNGPAVRHHRNGDRLCGYPTSLRVAVAGTVLCAVVLGTSLLIDFAPRSETPSPAVPRLWQQPPGRPSWPPPTQAF